MVKLGEVAKERRESIKTDKTNMTIVGLEHLIPQQIQLTEWSNDTDNTFTKVFHKGDILFGRRRAYLKKAALAPFDGICSGDITVIAPIENKITPELLPFIIQNDAFFDYAVEKSAGSLSPRVKWEHLKNYEFELPSLEEQKKLAKILWTAEETKQAYKTLLQKTDDMVKAKFDEMFGNLKDNDKHFSKCKLKNLMYIERGGSPRPIEQYLNTGREQVNWIKIGDADENSKYIYKTKDKINITGIKKSRHVEPGDFLLSNSMSFGRPYILKVDGYIHDGWLVLRDTKNLYNKIFLYEALTSNYAKNSFCSLAVGSVVNNLNKELVGNLELIVPDIDLQNRFASFSTQAEQSKQQLQKSLDSLNAMTKALINENLK